MIMVASKLAISSSEYCIKRSKMSAAIQPDPQANLSEDAISKVWQQECLCTSSEAVSVPIQKSQQEFKRNMATPDCVFVSRVRAATPLRRVDLLYIMSHHISAKCLVKYDGS